MIATSVSGAIGKPSPVTIYIFRNNDKEMYFLQANEMEVQIRITPPVSFWYHFLSG